MTKDYYRVICEPINLILLIKKLTATKERQLFNKLRNKIVGLQLPVTVDSCKVWLIENLLYNSKELLSSIEDDVEEKEIITHAIYLSVVQVYPMFNLITLCMDLNNIQDAKRVLSTDIDEIFQKFQDSVKRKRDDSVSLDSIGDINKLKYYLDSNIIGQKKAVDSIVDCMKLITSGLYKSASFFFIGPTGVGKTELAKLLGEKYSGNFWKINCAEYSNSHEYAKLIGSPPGYVGHSDSSIMSEKAEKSNKWVILFDEIEKGHHKFYDFLLSLLDDGTCTDNMGRVLDFSESIFIFTSNQGISHLNTGRKIGFSKGTLNVSSCESEITESVKKKFPAEFMNRIDNYIFFNQLTRSDIKSIASIALKGLPVKKNKCLLDYITDNGYSEEYGARNIYRFIKNNVAPKIAQHLLEKRIPRKKGSLYTPKIKDNKFFIADASS